jgi:hypothetical protein
MPWLLTCSASLRTQFVEAGFYFTPAEDALDTVTCFQCEKTLGGWDATDDPLYVCSEP